MTTVSGPLRVFYMILLVFGSVGCAWFVARYVTHFRWWKTEIARHLIAMSSCLGLFFLYFIIVMIFPGLPGKTWIRSVLFVGTVACVIWRVVIFERFLASTNENGKEGSE